jgi:hypothetical protein
VKKLLCFLLFAVVTVPLQANNMKSASFYLNAPEKYEDKKITVYVACATRVGAIEGLDGVLYNAYTMSRDDSDTSYISVLVPKDKAESFARRYGSDFLYSGGNIRKLSLSGILRNIDDTWYIEYGN